MEQSYFDPINSGLWQFKWVKNVLILLIGQRTFSSCVSKTINHLNLHETVYVNIGTVLTVFTLVQRFTLCICQNYTI